MPRTDEEVVDILLELYAENFGGKEGQRFLISWEDLRSVYGFEKLFYSRFNRLEEAASAKRLYLWDLGEGGNGHQIAVIRSRTVDRWRRVPKRIIRTYKIEPNDSAEILEDDFE
ncbi:MAG: hypothetical protein C4567_00895 [Deltaproteobacteria bacterium]|nr:MAG: hypothetical protein C4567_00895 [Deltaproteobacteria bacterium]